MQREKEENMGGLGGEGGRSCTLLHPRQRINYLRADRRRLLGTFLGLTDILSPTGKSVVLRSKHTLTRRLHFITSMSPKGHCIDGNTFHCTDVAKGAKGRVQTSALWFPLES